jgi:hypothetical protein
LLLEDPELLVGMGAQDGLVVAGDVEAVEMQAHEAEGEVQSTLVAEHEATGVEEVPDPAEASRWQRWSGGLEQMP